MTVRTRFAPSPTGFLHIGGVRTALFNWLLARRHGGQFILRIDDTDQQRHVEEAVRLILDGFRWMGMDWDEGPEVGGPYGPYFQAQRGEFYRTAAQHLVETGKVYRDYSTEQERAADKAAADAAKRAYRFRRKPYSDQQIRQFEAEGRPFALRFEVPLGRKVLVNDLIKGPVEQSTDDIGDFVIVRPDGSPLYNFASVVDDAQMRITHVVRAEEHLPNTYSQILIFEALGYDLPQFAHVPYVAEPGSKKKLSKRFGAVGLDHFIEQGYLPEAMMNYLARLGWSWDETSEIFTRDELIEKFSLDRVNSAPASHDPDKLFWVQSEWMKTLSPDRKLEGVTPYLAREGLVSLPLDEATRHRIERVVEALGDRLKVFSDILKLGRYFFTEDVAFDPDAVKKRLRKEGVLQILADVEGLLATIDPFDLPTLEEAIKQYSESTGEGLGKVVNAIRVATTGQGVGPGLYDCLVILGRDTCRNRIRQAIALLKESASG